MTEFENPLNSWSHCNADTSYAHQTNYSMRICFKKKNRDHTVGRCLSLLSFFIQFHSNVSIVRQTNRTLASINETVFNSVLCTLFLWYFGVKAFKYTLTIGLFHSFTCGVGGVVVGFTHYGHDLSCARVTDYPQIKCIVLIFWQLIKIKQVIGPSMVNWTAKN